MLMNVLPGVRDLRAPLAAGYLWLTGVWLLLVGLVPPRSTATGVILHVYGLVDYLGRGITLAIVTFVAYLVGSVLSVDADGLVESFLERLFSLGRAKIRIPRSYSRPEKRKISGSGASRKLVHDIQDSVNNLKGKVPAIPTYKCHNRAETDAALAWNASLNAQSRRPDQRPQSDLTVRAIGVWQNLAWTMISSLIGERRQLVIQLRGSKPELFDQYDRARGEAEFRLSVAFPLIFIAGALAWYWRTPLCGLLLLGAVVIMKSGISRARRATDVICQAALAGYVTPSGWLDPKSKPLTIAREAFDSELRNMSYRDQREGQRESQFARTILRLLSEDEEKEPKTPISTLSD